MKWHLTTRGPVRLRNRLYTINISKFILEYIKLYFYYIKEKYKK